MYQWWESQKRKGGEVWVGRALSLHTDRIVTETHLLVTLYFFFSLSCLIESTLLCCSRRRQAWYLAHRGTQGKAGQDLGPVPTEAGSATGAPAVDRWLVHLARYFLLPWTPAPPPPLSWRRSHLLAPVIKTTFRMLAHPMTRRPKEGPSKASHPYLDP